MSWTEFAYVELGVIGILAFVWLLVAGLRASLRSWTVSWAREAERLGLQVVLDRATPAQLPPISLQGTYKGRHVEVRAARDSQAARQDARGHDYFAEVRLDRRGRHERYKGKHRGKRLGRLLDRLVEA